MIQKKYHIKNFSDGDFERVLEEISSDPAYQSAAKVLLLAFEQNWKEEKIREKTASIKRILPKAEAAGVTHFDEESWGSEMKEQTVLSVLFFETDAFTIEKLPLVRNQEAEVGRKMNQRFHQTANLKGVMVFLAEYMQNADLLLEEADKGLKDIPIFGGTGSLQESTTETGKGLVFDLEDCYQDTILMILFHGKDLHLKVSHNYGWTPVGKKMTVTKMDGDFRVLEIDDKPAFDIYGKYLGILDEKMMHIPNICEFPLAIRRGEINIGRVPSFTDQDRALNFLASMKEGEELRFTYGAQTRIFSQIFEDSMDFCDFAPQGMLLVICMNRMIFLKEQEKHEIEYYMQIAPELAYLHGNSEIYFCNGSGGEVHSALIAIGIREGEEKRKPVEFEKLQRDIFEEDRIRSDQIIPLEYRVMTFMDAVTNDLERMTKRANAANEAKSAFLSSMSHEIRTPINAVLGMDEMILRESMEESTLEYAENIRVAGNTLLGLVNDILDFSKIEAGKMELVEAEYEVASSLHDLIVMISIRAQNKGLELRTNIDKTLPSVLYGDEIRIKQVITNILTNAVKYTEEGSVTLSVRSEKKDENYVDLYVSVKDTGIGIKEEDIPKLYSEFERIEEKRNRTIEGTGLGMNITTRLLSMMGSDLSVSSVYGEGSDFSFVIRQKVLSWEPIGDMDTAWKNSVQGRQRYEAGFVAPEARILAVDDTEMNLTVLKGLLKPMHMQIDTASSGQECLEMITEKTYDIIFLDHRMPDMDGIETRERMESLSDNKNSSTPVVALTANAVSGAKEEYLRHGFTDYLTKPIDTEDLEKMLIKYLPKEKVKEADGKRNSSDETKIPADEEQIIDLKEILSSVDGLDYHYAKLHLPTEELLQTAVEDFYKVIVLHADRLDAMYERLPEKKAVEEYRIQVHGMKSSAATIGIVPLAGMAKVLEDAARDEEVEQIKNLHGAFITLWREYQERLENSLPFLVKKEEEKAFYEEKVFDELLEILQMSVEDFDIEKADETLKLIGMYSYPEQMEMEIRELQAAVSDVDFDTAEEILKRIKAACL